MPSKQTQAKETKAAYRTKRKAAAKSFHATYTVVIEPDEGGFHAYVPALPGCHTFGDSIEEARANISEAMELHIESLSADGESIPIEREPLFITRLSVPIAA